MFKKQFQTSSTNVLSKADRKEFYNKKIKNSFLNNTELIEQYLFEYKWYVVKLSGIKKYFIMTCINNEKIPLFFEYDKDVFYPTVYTLNLIPDLIKDRICLIYPETNLYLENGADLMIKGILNFDIIKSLKFNLGNLFKVCIYDDTCINKCTAIGISLTSSNLINSLNEKGKFLSIVHIINDEMFNYGNKVILPSLIVNNEDKLNNNIDCKILDFNNKIQDKNTINENNYDSNNINIENNDSKSINNNNNITNESCSTKISKDEIDLNITRTFYTLLKYSTEIRKSLPLDPGKLLQSFMIPTASKDLNNINISFKNSSFKGINNFLKHISKDHKSITFGKNDKITSININDKNELYIKYAYDFSNKKDFVLYCDSTINNPSIKKDNILLNNEERIEIKQYYKPINALANYISKIHLNHKKDSFYELKVINEIILNDLINKGFINKEVINQNEQVKLNDNLVNIFRVRPIEQENNSKKIYPKSISINELIDCIKSNLIEKDKVVMIDEKNNSSILLSNNAKMNILIIAKKFNNKNITAIDGLQKMFDLSNCCKIFSKSFACSVSIKSILGIDNMIVIQGYWVYELIDILENELKIQRKYIKIDDKLKLKKKK